MFAFHFMAAALIPRKGTLFSSYLDHRDGVGLLFFGREHLSGHFFSSYNHGGLGNDHDPYVFGKYLQGPRHVSNFFYPLMSSLILRSARAFLGLAEGGLFPGVTYYLSLWYPRQMQAKRVAIFFSAATVAGAFGGILAYGIGHLDG